MDQFNSFQSTVHIAIWFDSFQNITAHVLISVMVSDGSWFNYTNVTNSAPMMERLAPAAFADAYGRTT